MKWDHSIIPILDELGIPCAITSTPTAMCLNARMRFVPFLAPFFHKEKEADILFTYRSKEDGATSKAALGRINPLLKDIHPCVDCIYWKLQASS